MSNNKAYRIEHRNGLEILRAAMKCAYHVNVDQLDCAVSFCRQPTNITPEQIFEMVKKRKRKVLYNFQYRGLAVENYWDVGCNIWGEGEPDYFLWLRLSPEEGERLAQEYKLKALL